MMLLRARAPSPPPITIPGRVGRSLWILAGLDIVTVAWMISAGAWLDEASDITAVVTLGGHHRLVLGLALLGFVVLAALGVSTEGFKSAGRLKLALIAIGSAISVFALAGILLGLLLLLIGAVLLGLLARFFMRR